MGMIPSRTVRTPDLQGLLETVTAAQSNFSPDGSKVLVQSNLSGTAELYVSARQGGGLRQLTNFDDPVAGAYLPAGDQMVLVGADRGDEQTQLSVINDDGTDLRPLVRQSGVFHRLDQGRAGRSDHAGHGVGGAITGPRFGRLRLFTRRGAAGLFLHLGHRAG